MILLISEMRFKKISSKNIFSSWRKISFKKNLIFFSNNILTIQRFQIAHFPKKTPRYKDLDPFLKIILTLTTLLGLSGALTRDLLIYCHPIYAINTSERDLSKKKHSTRPKHPFCVFKPRFKANCVS